MSKCVKHIVENSDIAEALTNGDFGGETDISMQDDTGSFDLRGIKCVRCGELVDISYEQTEYDKAHIEISPDADNEMHWEDPIGSVCVEKHVTHKVFEIKKMVERSEFVQKCEFCGSEQSSMILDHVKKHHPKEYKKLSDGQLSTCDTTQTQ
jgi:hypothetical protein